MYPPGKQPDTEEDAIALGFITTKSDAVLLRIESSTTQDYMELEIVSSRRFGCQKKRIFEKVAALNCFIVVCSMNRSREIFSWFTMLDHTIFHLAKSALRSMTTLTILFDSNDSEAMQHYNWMIITYKLFIRKVRIS